MSNFNIDRLKFRWKGNWSTGLEYIKDDVVYFDGKAYVCLQGHTASTFFNDNYASESVTFTVTVSTDTLDANTQGKFYINSIENPTLPLMIGKTYIFNQDAASNDNNPLLLSNIIDGDLVGGARYNNGVVYYLDDVNVSEANYLAGFSAATSREIRFTPSPTIAKNIYYYSSANPSMGNSLKTEYSSNWEVMFDGSKWRNNWSTAQFYTEGSFVKFNGYIYKCVVAHTSTVSLTADISNWALFASTYNWLNEWNTSTVYVLGDVVRHSGNTYVCTTSHTSAVAIALGLEADQEKWAIVTISDSWRADWAVSRRYIVNDIVKYGAIVYRCIQAHTSAATELLGLENDQAKWEIVTSGIEYKGDWQSAVRYKVNDVVKYRSSLWKANQAHTSTLATENLRGDEDKWDLWIPGLSYDLLHNIATEYAQGDVVLYGGYSYVALRNNVGRTPGSSPDDWKIITTGYNFIGDWASDVDYLAGDVVRSGGSLYASLISQSNNIPSVVIGAWEKIVEGNKYRAEWLDAINYYEGDIVVYRGTLYICINSHISTESESRPDLDIQQPDQDYWQVLIQSTTTNVLAATGDLKTFVDEITRLPISTAGQIVKSLDANAVWGGYDQVPNVFYVGTYGLDDPAAGRTLAAPFRTVKYACEYIFSNVDTNLRNTTLFIKTGYYEEELPISVPINTALVGDELRSTVISPAVGFEQSNMFYVRNGSGIRNMTLQGLSGTLGAPNENLTRRPSAGAYVSLDPGTGPDDETVWITTKSCYVQNVSTFGTGCIGMKIDGALHNGGNKSIVANDFTQILSDGIGYWAATGGRSELVSVFTYFCHIGYLATGGGILRATNGNNSYGSFGTVAEGFNNEETPLVGAINNRSQNAQQSQAITYGTNEQTILAIGYSHAGQDYTGATVAFGGSGIGAAGTYTEFRNNAISNFRLLDPGDSTVPGGFNYTTVVNNAQGGNLISIQLSQADIRNTEDYVGQRIIIVSGLGVGQYAEIAAYDAETKVAIVNRESDDTNGWEHLQPGWPIEPTLDSTTRYSIEPLVSVDEPLFENAIITGPIAAYKFIAFGEGKFVAVTGGSENYDAQAATYSTDGGTTWNSELDLDTGYDIVGLTYTGDRFLAVRRSNSNSPHNTILQSLTGETWTAPTLPITSLFADISSDGNGNVAIVTEDQQILYSSDNGDSWSTSSIGGSGQVFGKLQYNSSKLIAIEIGGNGDVAYSIDNGATWTITSAAIPQNTWNDVTYGNGRFVAIDNTLNSVVYSFDGIVWIETSIDLEQGFSDTYNRISYGEGVFIATGQGNTIARSQSGARWTVFNKDSTVYSLSEVGSWTGSAYADGKWVVLRDGSSNWNTITTGATPVVRAVVTSSAISSLIIYDPGSNLPAQPTVSIFDNSNTIEAVYNVYVNNGVLAQPEMSNRGTGYFTANATISGDGFADLYQTGVFLNVTNLTGIPEPGDNLTINGVDDVLYSVVKLISISESEPYTARIQITPNIGVAEAPDHNTSITLRKQFSQIRLTGHDFLDIGTGNVGSTRYPQLYVEGINIENETQPFNEALGFGGGRVFFTSTDQDGNFKVGSLFKVEQSTGVVTVDASQFNLSGLTELAIGGIQVGVTPVIIREFSVDSEFIANSNNIVPTQKAIAGYVESRISGGGSDVSTNTLIAGQVRITGNNINTTSDLPIDIPVVAINKQGFEGEYLALQFFSRSSSR
jgi:hypothetical protein